MVTLDTLNLTPEFVASFRALGRKVGYRNLGRAIAYTKPDVSGGLLTTPSIAPNGNGRKTYGRTSKHLWYCLKAQVGIPKGHRTCCCYKVCETCLTHDEHRFTHKVKWPFTYSVYRSSDWKVTVSDLVAQNLPARVCCKHKMSLTPDYTDAHHWRYQCDKNPDHCQDVMITIGPS